MARRPDTESDDSHKEHVELNPNGERPERRSSRRKEKARVVEDDGVSDNESSRPGASQPTNGDAEDEDDEAAGSSRGKKRSRVNEDGESVQADGDVEDEEPAPTFSARRVVLERDEFGFVTGSVKRVKLHQFLTYDDVEFDCGSHLNIILGPNGTGKSSISCALCIGLNAKPSLLGRATEAGQFVKIGYNEGSVELQMTNHPGKKDIIIKRVIKKLDATEKRENRSKSIYFIDGKEVTGTRVTELVKELGIQVDNLCTFLPQDRVAEFARMSPQQLLRATESAAGDVRLYEWHEDLIAAGEQLKSEFSHIEADQAELLHKETRNGLLQKEVEQYKQRRQIERQLELLDVIIPYKAYVLAKDKYDLLKQQRREAHEVALRLQEKNRPFQDFKDKLEKQYSDCEKRKNQYKDTAKRKLDMMKKKSREYEKLENDSEKIYQDLKDLREEEKRRKDRIEKNKQERETIKHKLENPPETESLEDIKQELRTNADVSLGLNKEKDPLESEMRKLVDESETQKATIVAAKSDLSKLDDVSHRKFEALERWDRDVAQAVKWIRMNKNKFRMEVIEPACLSLSVKDSRFASAVEGCFSGNQLKTIVAQCREDYDTLNKAFNDSEDALGRRCRIGFWFRKVQEDQLLSQPLTEEEMEREHFEKYAIDCCDFPEGMRWYLQRELNLHRTGIGLTARNINVQRAIDLFSRFDERGRGGAGNFVAGSVMNNITRSRYGQRLPQAMTRDLRPARNLAFPPVDEEKKRYILARIQEGQQKVTIIEEGVAKTTELLRAIERQLAVVDHEKQDIDARKQLVLEEQKKLQKMRNRIQQLDDKIKHDSNLPPMDEKKQILRKKLLDVAKQGSNITKALEKLARECIADTVETTRAGLEHIQVGANKRALDELCKSRNASYQKARDAHERISKEFDQQKVETKRLVEISRVMTDSIDEDLQVELANKDQYILETSMEDLQQEQENLKASLDLIVITDPTIVQTFERREQEIAALRQKIESNEEKRGKLERRVRKIRSKFDPALKELVEVVGKKFSDAFDGVGCAGEIKIEEHADYKLWALEILVKFRDTEKLQKLTGQRQSGGERALTTIMFLMSLTEMNRSPFSLVDEINQGMDAQYERAVHNSLVDVTCRKDSGQIFLITPKLLTDLKYDKRMKVLCVSNGEWLPDQLEDRCGNMGKMLDNYLKHPSRRAA